MSFDWEFYINYLEFCTGDLSISPPIIYLSNHLLTSMWLMDIYSILRVIIQCYFILLFKLSQFWTLGLFLLDPVLTDMHVAMWFFLLSSMTRFSGLILDILALVLKSFSQGLAPFTDDLYWQSRAGAWCACCSWSIVTSGPSQLTEEGNICAHINPCICTLLQMQHLNLNLLIRPA